MLQILSILLLVGGGVQPDTTALDLYTDGKYLQSSLAFLEIYETELDAYDPEHNYYSTITFFVARSSELAGELEQAERFYQKTIQVFKNYHLDNTVWYGLSLNYLAELKRNHGEVQHADSLLIEAKTTLYDRYISPMLPSDVWYQVLMFRDTHHPDYLAKLQKIEAQLWAEGKVLEAELTVHESLEINGRIRNGFLSPLQQYRKATLITLRFGYYGRKSDEPTEVLARSVYNLAEMYRAYMENCGRAIPLYQAALTDQIILEGEHSLAAGKTHHRLARCKQELNKPEEAAYHYEKAVAAKFNHAADEPEAYIGVLLNAGEFFRARSRFTLAEQRVLDAKHASESYLDANHPDRITALNNLGGVYLETGRYLDAHPLFMQVHELQREVYGSYHPDIAISLNNIAGVYRELYETERADSLYHEALQITLNHFGELHHRTLEQWNNIGGFYRETGRYSKAEPYFRNIIENVHSVYAVNDPLYPAMLNNVAGFYRDRGDYSNARNLYKEAIQLFEHTQGQNNVQYVNTLQNLALLENNIGNVQDAEVLYQSAIMSYEEMGLAAYSELALTYRNYGRFHMQRGDMNQADLYLRKSLEVTGQAYGEQHPEFAVGQNALGELHLLLGNEDRSESYFQYAKMMLEEFTGSAHPILTNVLNNLAVLESRNGNHQKAGEIYADLQSRVAAARGTDHPQYATISDNLAGAFEKQNRLKKAAGLYNEAFKTRIRTLGENHPSVAISMNNLAGVHAKAGNVKSAENLYRQAIQIRETVYGDYPPEHSTFLNNLIILMMEQGEYTKAEDEMVRAVGQLKNEIQNRFRFLPEDQKLVFVESAIHRYHFYQHFFTRMAEKNPDYAVYAIELEGMITGIVLDSVVQLRNRLSRLNDEKLMYKYEEWLLTRSEIARQYSLPVGERGGDFEELKRTAEELERSLVRSEPGFELQRNWTAKRNSLNPDEAWVTFLNTHEYEAGKLSGWSRYGALVIRPNADYPVYVPLFLEDEWEEMLQNDGQSDQQFVDGLYRTINRERPEIPHYGQKLFEKVWKPVLPYLDDISRVFYSPAGMLHQISMAAIPVDEETLLSDHFHLTRIISTVPNTGETEQIADVPDSILLFGGIQFDADLEDVVQSAMEYGTTLDASLLTSASVRSSDGAAWSELPGTAREVETIVKLADAASVSAEYISGNRAVEEAVKFRSGTSAPDILHIATHGFFFENSNPEEISGISQGDYQQLGERLFRRSENPLQRSGLVFAGVNHAWAGNMIPAGLDDGVLTAGEISALDLSGTSLAVLSACETGLGEVRGSEGVFGLQRAFKMAGVENLIMSLWKVPDAETAEFMTLFYESLFSKKSISDAFHEAQAEMKNRYREEPFKWAAFVLLR